MAFNVWRNPIQNNRERSSQKRNTVLHTCDTSCGFKSSIRFNVVLHKIIKPVIDNESNIKPDLEIPSQTMIPDIFKLPTARLKEDSNPRDCFMEKTFIIPKHSKHFPKLAATNYKHTIWVTTI